MHLIESRGAALFTASLAIVLLFCAAGCTPTSAQSGPFKIDNSDGTYHYSNTPGGTADYWDGPVLWRYQGQANYSWNPVLWQDGTMIFDAVSEADDDGASELWNAVRFDDQGRRWGVVAVDTVALSAHVATYNSQPIFATEVVGVDDPDPEYNPVAGEDGWWRWHTWAVDVCGPDTDTLWDSDDRQPFSSPPTIRQNKSVFMFTGPGLCSGTLLSDDRVLTAAHCITDDTGAPLDKENMVVCTRGNRTTGAQCAKVLKATFNENRFLPQTPGDRTRFSRVSWDIAVLEIDTALGASGNFMGLSNARGSTIRSNPTYLSAYPTRVPGTCNLNFSSTGGLDPLTTLNSGGFWQDGTTTGTTSRIQRTRLDNGGGESGGAYYYYPGGCCGDHAITGVVSGHFENPRNADNSFNGGARVRPRRNFILGLVP